MREVFLYLFVALSGLAILGFSVHMLVGGLVTPSSEKLIVIFACLLGAMILAVMAWDVLRRRRKGTTFRGY